MKILHCPGGSAGQPTCIANKQKELGYVSDSLRVGDSKFGYKADIEIDDVNIKGFHRAFMLSAQKYDVFHFYFRPFYYHHKNVLYPMGLDILTLKALGKSVVMHFRGSEIRLHSEFEKLSPYNYVAENPSSLTSKFPEYSQRAYLSLMEALCDKILVPDPELQSYCPSAEIVPRAIDLEDWPFVGVQDHVDTPLIVHAPSRQVVKGTHYLIEALEKLKSEGVAFRYQQVEDMSNEEARKVYQRADIVVDQLRIGWYGVLAVETMALGKPTLAYIRDDLKKHLLPDAPIRMTSKESLYEDLGDLIGSLEKRRQLSKRARKYVEKVHDSNVVASRLIGIYEECRRNPVDIDIDRFGDYLLTQPFYRKKKNFASKKFDPLGDISDKYSELGMREFLYRGSLHLFKKFKNKYFL